jgi:hypothetical protein
MSANVGAEFPRETDGRSHRRFITRVSAAGNVDRSQEWYQAAVVIALADVAIEIDRMCTIAKHPCNFSLIPVGVRWR